LCENFKPIALLFLELLKKVQAVGASLKRVKTI